METRKRQDSNKVNCNSSSNSFFKPLKEPANSSKADAAVAEMEAEEAVAAEAVVLEVEVAVNRDSVDSPLDRKTTLLLITTS